MPLTGTDPAMMVARLGTMRLGASRLGYYEPWLTMTINGVARQATAVDGLTIVDTEGGTPNTATMRVTGFTPVYGQEIRIGLGGLERGQLIFAGHILHTTQVYVGSPTNIHYDLFCISYEWRLNTTPVTGKFLSTSATDIVLWIMSGVTGFSTAGVQAGLPSIDEMTFTNVDRLTALDRVRDRIGGAWVVDYASPPVLHFGLAITPWASAIHPITTADPHGMTGIAKTVDLSQVRTRAEVEGGGANATAQVLAGTTALPIGDPSWYDAASGGTVVAGPQRITYTGVVTGGAGALVGTTITPTNGPTVAKKTATGLSAGAFGWAVSFGTAAGRTLPSPITNATMGGTVPAPAGALTATEEFDGNLGGGTYQWKTTFADAAGRETTTSPARSLTMTPLAPPASIGISDGFNGGGALDSGVQYGYKGTFYSATKGETTPGPASTFTTVPANGDDSGALVKSGTSAAPSGFVRRFYRTEGGGSTYKLMPGAVLGFEYEDGSNWYDEQADGVLGAVAPSTNTAHSHKANLSSIPVSTDANITTVNIYRTEANGSVFKLAGSVSNGTTTWQDNVADGSLGATAPTVATALYLSADLSNIPLGPTGTTYRDLFRTVADGAQLKFLGTLSNNTATVFTDTTADGSLGANAPTTDTSGLVAQSGEVAAGSTSLLVTALAPFRAGGGWAYIGALPIRYTGISGTALTGIPATGPGALGTTARYGSEVIAASMLTGIPASGAGAILYDIPAGEPVNIFITRNDLAAQAILAALLTTSTYTHDGIVVEPIQDRRWSKAECEDRGDARLAQVKDPLVSLAYQTPDLTHKSAREVTFALDAPTSIAGTFKVLRVTLSQFEGGRSRPIRTVEASSRRFSLEALLRFLKAA